MSENNEPYQVDEPMVIDPNATEPEYVDENGQRIDERDPESNNPFLNPPALEKAVDDDEILLQDGQIIEPVDGDPE